MAASSSGPAGLLPLSLGLLRARTVDEVLTAVAAHGPIVLGGHVSVVLVRGRLVSVVGASAAAA